MLIIFIENYLKLVMVNHHVSHVECVVTVILIKIIRKMKNKQTGFLFTLIRKKEKDQSACICFFIRKG